jgi:hypothetical protein
MNIKDTIPSGGCHIVILGAGASIAATLRDPEIHGLQLVLSQKDLGQKLPFILQCKVLMVEKLVLL